MEKVTRFLFITYLIDLFLFLERDHTLPSLGREGCEVYQIYVALAGLDVLDPLISGLAWGSSYIFVTEMVGRWVLNTIAT